MKTGKYFHAQKIAATATIILAALAFSTWFLIPDPTPFQAVALRTIVALLGAMAVYSFPSSLAMSLEARHSKFIRAGGALVVFLLLYMFAF